IHTPSTGAPDEPLRVINVTLADNVGTDNVGEVPEAVKVEGMANAAMSRNNQFVNTLISSNAVGITSDGNAVASLQKILIADDVTTKPVGFAPERLTGTPRGGNAGFVGAGNYQLIPTAPGVDAGDAV